MDEWKGPEYVDKLPIDKHSTKGLGGLHPDPKLSHKLDGIVEIPNGPAVNSGVYKSSLQYNEYS